MALIADWQRAGWTITDIAETGLTDRSRAPKQHGRALAEETRDAVLAMRRQFPHRRPKKLRALLQRRHPSRAWPAASTIGDWIRAAELNHPRRRARYVTSLTDPLRAAQAPNDLWTADFNGRLRT